MCRQKKGDGCNWGNGEVVWRADDGGKTPGFVCERVGWVYDEDKSRWWDLRSGWVVGKNWMGSRTGDVDFSNDLSRRCRYQRTRE